MSTGMPTWRDLLLLIGVIVAALMIASLAINHHVGAHPKDTGNCFVSNPGFTNASYDCNQ